MLNLSKCFNEEFSFKHKGLQFNSLKHYYLFCLAFAMQDINSLMKVNQAKLKDLDSVYEDLKSAKGYVESYEKTAFDKFFVDLGSNTKLMNCINYLKSGDSTISIDLIATDEIATSQLDYLFAILISDRI